jgi:transmembrane sensor
MNTRADNRPTIEEEASETFVQQLHGEWADQDQAAFEARLERDPAYADAYARAQESWGALDAHAESAEVMRYREEAIAYARRSNAHRWFKPHTYAGSGWRAAAAIAGVAILLGFAWQLSPYGYTPGQYNTGIGEQRVVDLEDHSRIVLDAATRLRVRFTRDARIVELQDGQAQFSVAKDPTRPFKVNAGGRTIVAVGTVFTVEYVDSQVHVAMMEGEVAVVTTAAAATEPADAGGGEGISLIAGEELRVSRDGRSTVTPKADLEAATAWREGKVVLRTEPLSKAVQRMNRYSRLQIKVDDAALAAKQISGVFEAGDTKGFVSAIERYLPVVADYADSHTVNLRMKQ